MAELESQPLSAEERAELEELRAEKARREAQEEARREREELAAPVSYTHLTLPTKLEV